MMSVLCARHTHTQNIDINDGFTNAAANHLILQRFSSSFAFAREKINGFNSNV